MTATPKPATKRASSRKPKTKPRQPDHNEIAERAYLIYLGEGASDELANWLRAQRELTAT